MAAATQTTTKQGEGNEPYTVVETITPEMATKYFEANGANRPISDVAVDAYSRDIVSGRWDLTGESIKFSRSGRLLDGQHRLLAIIKAARPVRMMVTYGLRESVMDSLDSGRVRSVGDRLKIMQGQRIGSLHVPPQVIAAICGQISILTSGNAATRHRIRLTYAEALETFQKYESEIGWVLTAIGYRIDPGNNFSGGAPVLACFAWCRSINRDKLEALAYEFKHGADATGKRRLSPAATALRDAVASGWGSGQRRTDAQWRRSLIPKTLRAIEAYLNDEDIKRITKVEPEVYERILAFKQAHRGRG